MRTNMRDCLRVICESPDDFLSDHGWANVLRRLEVIGYIRMVESQTGPIRVPELTEEGLKFCTSVGLEPKTPEQIQAQKDAEFFADVVRGTVQDEFRKAFEELVSPDLKTAMRREIQTKYRR